MMNKEEEERIVFVRYIFKMKRSRSTVLDDDPGLLQVVAFVKERGWWTKTSLLQEQFGHLALGAIVKALTNRGLAVKCEGGSSLMLVPDHVVKRVELMTEERNERHLKVVLFDVASCCDQGISKKLLKKKGLATNLVEDGLKRLLDEGLVVQIKPPQERELLFLPSWIAPSAELVGQLWYSEELRAYNRTLIDLELALICQSSRPSSARRVVPLAEVEREFVRLGPVLYRQAAPTAKFELKEADMKPLLAILIADGSILQLHDGLATTQRGMTRIEKVRPVEDGKQGNKKAKTKEVEDPSSGSVSTSGAFSMPCPTCPQRSVCTPEGRVNPKQCEPLQTWLSW